MGFGSDVLSSFAIVHYKRRALNEVSRRIAADGKLGKQDEPGPLGFRPLREVDDFCGVAGEVSDRRINLAQRDLHCSSVKGRAFLAKSGCMVLRQRQE